ncbi:MAG: hypothetical protein ABIQ95_07785, partial [Bdellovibrionia bacterium]
MELKKDFFPTRSQLPKTVEIPKVHGRILIGGKIMDSGFATKPVFSPCSVRNESDDSLSFPEIGTTPQVDKETFMSAVEAASKAWSKGLGEWPSARME